MAQELAYVLINPYTLMKSRTGGVIARLFARTNLDLVGARMFAPGKELVDEFCHIIAADKKQKNEKIRKEIIDYIKHFYIKPPIHSKRHNRVLLLLFKGENAVRKLRKVVGPVAHKSISGETIRDTYGDYIEDRHGDVRYFEPAVIAPPCGKSAIKRLEVWARYSSRDGGLLNRALEYRTKKNIQETLVLIKPDNFRGPSGRAGNIIDLFSKTGLYIIGAKVLNLSLKEAEEFYGPVREVLAEKLQGQIKERIKETIESMFGFSVPDASLGKITTTISELNAQKEFNNIVKFMTGIDRTDPKTRKNKEKPGKVKCLALVYQGPNAISKIRNQLGATNPRRADWATVRKEFGQNIMENTAHASDSPANAKRELKIVKIEQDDISKWLKIIKRQR